MKLEEPVKVGRCRIRVRIRARGRDVTGYVVRLFEDGMELLTDQVEGIWTGDQVEVTGDRFGPMVGTARWRIPRRLGVKFRDMKESEAGLRDLWRFSDRSPPAGKVE
ncbi:MAG: hypothetical protein JJ913_15385 [Rhizobiaceae bacterium]|nr:hypothetical protein [Rhizobiaceae bacterium]